MFVCAYVDLQCFNGTFLVFNLFKTLFYGNTGRGAPVGWERAYTFDYIRAYSQAAEKR